MLRRQGRSAKSSLDYFAPSIIATARRHYRLLRRSTGPYWMCNSLSLLLPAAADDEISQY